MNTTSKTEKIAAPSMLVLNAKQIAVVSGGGGSASEAAVNKYVKQAGNRVKSMS